MMIFIRSEISREGKLTKNVFENIKNKFNLTKENTKTLIKYYSRQEQKLKTNNVAQVSIFLFFSLSVSEIYIDHAM
jgi:adenylate kinase family enzyme